MMSMAEEKLAVLLIVKFDPAVAIPMLEATLAHWPLLFVRHVTDAEKPEMLKKEQHAINEKKRIVFIFLLEPSHSGWMF